VAERERCLARRSNNELRYVFARLQRGVDEPWHVLGQGDDEASAGSFVDDLGTGWDARGSG